MMVQGAAHLVPYRKRIAEAYAAPLTASDVLKRSVNDTKEVNLIGPTVKQFNLGYTLTKEALNEQLNEEVPKLALERWAHYMDKAIFSPEMFPGNIVPKPEYPVYHLKIMKDKKVIVDTDLDVTLNVNETIQGQLNLINRHGMNLNSHPKAKITIEVSWSEESQRRQIESARDTLKGEKE